MIAVFAKEMDANTTLEHPVGIAPGGLEAFLDQPIRCVAVEMPPLESPCIGRDEDGHDILNAGSLDIGQDWRGRVEQELAAFLVPRPVAWK